MKAKWEVTHTPAGETWRAMYLGMQLDVLPDGAGAWTVLCGPEARRCLGVETGKALAEILAEKQAQAESATA